MALIINNLTKSFGQRILFQNLDLSFTEGTLNCIMGPSGCGKTTLLNIIAGLELADSGEFSGWEGKKLSYAFQEPRLLPWRTVRENIQFTLDPAIDPALGKEKVDNLLKNFKLSEFADYYPARLSGGLRQRCSLARALASPHDILLLDEPFTGLDTALRQELSQWMFNSPQDPLCTTICITHDPIPGFPTIEL